LEVARNSTPIGMLSFGNFVRRSLVEQLRELKITVPNIIQAEALRLALDERDVMVVAQTGSGKTLTFLLPILQRLSTNPRKRGIRSELCPECEPDELELVQPEAIVIVPTVELAMQHTDVATRLCSGLPEALSIECVARGAAGESAQLLITTVDPLMARIQAGSVGLQNVSLVAIDEVDAVLCRHEAWLQEVSPQAKELLSALTKNSTPQFLLATAYLSAAHEQELIARFPEAAQVRQKSVGGGKTGTLAPTLRQRFHYFNPTFTTKDQKLVQLLKTDEGGSTLVFCDTSLAAEGVYALIQEALPQLEAQVLHREQDEECRFAAMRAFRVGEATLLVCTTAAARGLDFPSLQRVVMYDMSEDVAQFIHCIGRTARCGGQGVVDCLVRSGDQIGQYRNLHALQDAPKLW